MLLRGADDFLYMTTSKELAQKFLAVINEGFPSHGCNFNKTKTQTNLVGKGHFLKILKIFEFKKLKIGHYNDCRCLMTWLIMFISRIHLNPVNKNRFLSIR